MFDDVVDLTFTKKKGGVKIQEENSSPLLVSSRSLKGSNESFQAIFVKEEV